MNSNDQKETNNLAHEAGRIDAGNLLVHDPRFNYNAGTERQLIFAESEHLYGEWLNAWQFAAVLRPSADS